MKVWSQKKSASPSSSVVPNALGDPAELYAVSCFTLQRLKKAKVVILAIAANRMKNLNFLTLAYMNSEDTSIYLFYSH